MMVQEYLNIIILRIPKIIYRNNSKGSKRFWERHGFKAQDDGTGVLKHYYFKATEDNFINENIKSASVK